MCYDVAQMKFRQYKWALRQGVPEKEAQKLYEEWLELEKGRQDDKSPMFHVNGFQHPFLYTIVSNENGWQTTRFQWGLIPHWVRDQSQAFELMNRTLNARGETIFEKAFFRESASGKRCLIVVDGFFEYHHKGGKAFPHFIQHIEKDIPIVFGGLWAEWVDKVTGQIVHTATIVTTSGNELMSVIHNNPKLDGPRMPLILDEYNFDQWLNSTDKSEVQELIKPYEDGRLKAHTVRKLKGANTSADTEEVIEEFYYDELVKQGELL